MTSDPLYQTLPNPLRQKVLQMVQTYPDTLDVINEIIMHYTPELVHKKQKKDLSTIGSLIYTLPDFSFISPIRKKVSLKLHQTGLSLADLSIPYVDIDRILCFETPNKSKLNWTVVIKTKSTSHLMNSNTIIFSFDDVIKGFKITHIGDNFKLTNRIPKQLLFEAFSKTMHKLNVVEPDPLFVSKSKSKFIDCYNRAKDGVLVFFEDSLFFGLKKPLMYFDREMIQNIQIVGITNRTFNIHLELKANDNDKEYDLDLVEFSLIDLVEMEFVESFIRRFLKQSNGLSSNKIKSKMETGDATNLAADVILSEDDEDYISGQDIDDVAEEFDSDHNSGSEEIEEDEDEEGSVDLESESEDEKETEIIPKLVSKAATNTKTSSAANRMKDQAMLIEKQRQERKGIAAFFKPKPKPSAKIEEEDLQSAAFNTDEEEDIEQEDASEENSTNTNDIEVGQDVDGDEDMQEEEPIEEDITNEEDLEEAHDANNNLTGEEEDELELDDDE